MCFHNLHQAGALVHGEVHFALEAGDHIERRPVVKMDHSGIGIRREDANPAREASQVSSCRSILVVLWGRLRMYLSIGPRFRSEMHCRNCGDGNIPPLVLNNYVGHWTSMLATGHLLWPLDRRANSCRRWHVGKEKALGLRQVWVVAIRSGRDWSQALESKVRFADKPDIIFPASQVGIVAGSTRSVVRQSKH